MHLGPVQAGSVAHAVPQVVELWSTVKRDVECKDMRHAMEKISLVFPKVFLGNTVLSQVQGWQFWCPWEPLFHSSGIGTH